MLDSSGHVGFFWRGVCPFPAEESWLLSAQGAFNVPGGQAHPPGFNKSPWQERTLREAETFLVSLGYLKGESTLKLPESALPDLKKFTTEK